MDQAGEQDGGSKGMSRQQRGQMAAPLTQDAVEQLLQVSLRAARAGNHTAARAVLHALTQQHPDELRAWLHLAELAASEDEQRQAFQHVLMLDPEHPVARQGLQQLQPPITMVEPAPSPESDAQNQPSHQRWLYLAAVASVLFLVALWILISLTGDGRTASIPTSPTAMLPGQSGMLPLPNQTASSLAAYPIPTPTFEPRPSMPLAASATATLPLLPTLAVPAAITSVPLGTILEHDGWQVTLSRPNYVQFLDGAIGDMQPGGRFVMALLTVGNRAEAPRSIPPDLFLLIDAQGRSYRALAPASRTYLQIYGPSHGDLAIDDPLPPGGSLYSIPLIFDVSSDATDLILTIGQQAGQGWRVLEVPPPSGDNNTGP